MSSQENNGTSDRPPPHDPYDRLTEGYRFFVVDDPRDARAALEVRSTVYAQKVGAEIPVPDEFDEYSWILASRHLSSGEIVGTMRATPHDHGPFECERFFDVPLRILQSMSIEITRFAVLPEHRRRPDSLPPVSLGLFRLMTEIARRRQTDWLVIASRENQIETYRWLGFEQTGLVSSYGALGGASHELLFGDFRARGDFEWHGLQEFFTGPRAEIEMPEPMPEPGAWLRKLRQRRAAAGGAP